MKAGVKGYECPRCGWMKSVQVIEVKAGPDGEAEPVYVMSGIESAMTAPVAATIGGTRIFMTDMRGLQDDTLTQMITVDNPNHVANEALQIEIDYDTDERSATLDAA